MAVISLQKKFKFSVSLLRRTWEKITLDNFASCCQQKNKPGLVECEEDSHPLFKGKKKNNPRIKQIKQKHKQSLSSTPLRNNKEKSVFCFSRYSRERFFFFLVCFQVLRDFIIYQERHILPNERLLTFMNVTVQLQPIHMQSSVDKGFGKCD